MLLNRWPSNSNNNNKENIAMKLKPGAFSNPGDITAQYYNDKTSKTLPSNYERKGSRDHGGNVSSIDSYSRIASQLTTDNDATASMFEMNLLDGQLDNRSTQHDTSLSFKGLIEKVNPQNVRSSYNLAQINGLKGDSSQKSLAQSANGNSAKTNKAMGYAHMSKANSQKRSGSASNTSAKQNRTPKTPTSNNRRSISREPENNENIDINIFMVPNHSQGKTKSSVEKDRKPFGIVNRDENEPNDEIDQLRKTNKDLSLNLKKTTAELQNEKNKVAILENELNNQTNSITEERAKYQAELLKISQQIKKLRNIQNIYVNEKKHSEKLEGQLNQKEKNLNDLSSFLCECLKSMNGIVEHLLVKGDYHLEKNLSQYESTGIEISDYLRLIHEVRRQIVPRLEAAEGFQFNFEWRNQDYKQVIYTTKELMKNKRLQNMRSQNGERNSSSSPIPSDRKLSGSTASLHGSKHSNSRSNPHISFQLQPVTTTSTYSYSVSNPTETGLPTEILTTKTDLGVKPSSIYQSNRTNDVRSTRANSNAINEYHPANVRVSSLGNQKIDEDSLGYEKPLESEGKGEDLLNLGEHMGTTSSILPRTNTMSAFNETFDNLTLEDKKVTTEPNMQNIAPKNYDYPLLTAPNQPLKSESDSLEAVKNKILKRKSEIEARRSSFQGSFCQQESSIQSFKDARDFRDPSKEENFSPRNESTSRSRDLKENNNIFLQEHHKSPERINQSYRNSSVPPIREKIVPSPDAKVVSSQKKGALTRSASNLLLGGSIEAQPSQNIVSNEKSPSQKQGSTPEKTESTEESIVKPLFAIAKFNYDPQKENDLCFNKGDKIQVLKKTKSGWWIGMCRNKIGYFPFNFVQIAE